MATTKPKYLRVSYLSHHIHDTCTSNAEPVGDLQHRPPANAPSLQSSLVAPNDGSQQLVWMAGCDRRDRHLFRGGCECSIFRSIRRRPTLDLGHFTRIVVVAGSSASLEVAVDAGRLI